MAWLLACPPDKMQASATDLFTFDCQLEKLRLIIGDNGYSSSSGFLVPVNHSH